MGEVYRARDTKLGREVALKVPPEEVAADAERMARCVEDIPDAKLDGTANSYDVPCANKLFV